MHLDATVQSNPQLRNNFDSCVSFLANQLTSLRTKNDFRNVTPLSTGSDSEEESAESLKAQIKELKAQLKARSKKKAHKKGTASKHKRKKPAAKWFELSKEEFLELSCSKKKSSSDSEASGNDSDGSDSDSSDSDGSSSDSDDGSTAEGTPTEGTPTADSEEETRSVGMFSSYGMESI